MEVTREHREDSIEEHIESSLPRRAGYEWVHEEVCLATSKFRWSRLLITWLNSIYVFY